MRYFERLVSSWNLSSLDPYISDTRVIEKTTNLSDIYTDSDNVSLFPVGQRSRPLRFRNCPIILEKTQWKSTPRTVTYFQSLHCQFCEIVNCAIVLVVSVCIVPCVGVQVLSNDVMMPSAVNDAFIEYREFNEAELQY